jgi:hypothetical protein
MDPLFPVLVEHVSLSGARLSARARRPLRSSGLEGAAERRRAWSASESKPEDGDDSNSDSAEGGSDSEYVEDDNSKSGGESGGSTAASRGC